VGFVNYPPSDCPHGGPSDPFVPVARFVCQGEATAYAMFAYTQFPAREPGHVRVYEVWKGKKKLYRAG